MHSIFLSKICTQQLSKGDTFHHCRCVHVIGVNMLFIVEANWLLVFTYTNRYCIFFRVAPTVDAVLLSHPDMMHLGALPYAMKHLGLSAPVYATEPVFRLGLLTMYDHFLSRWVSFMVLNIFLGRTLFNHTHFQYHIVSLPPSQYAKENWTPFCSLYLFTVDPYHLIFLLQQVSDFDLFTLDDVDAAFQNVVRLKYSQNYLLNGQ